jgi:cytochrome c-type biogenesis protein CcmF
VIAAFGLLGVIVAMFGSVMLIVRGFAPAARRDGWDASRFKVPAAAVLGGSALAMVALEVGLVADDFSISYIANNSASTTPLLYKMASAWAALEGSLVLWGLVLGVFVFAVWAAMSRREGTDHLGAAALGVMGIVSLFFFALMVTVSNPFEVCTATGGFGCAAESALPWATAVTPLEGFGPNPLLQNHPLMAIHPPMLYVGYVGLTVPFAFAIGALLVGEPGDGWLRRTRSWTRVAWAFLTAGIVLGGLWSYEVLGWGGYWAWDPVENASFAPWLVATAFMHSAAVQLRRGVLQAWNFILVISAFSLTILGTFLTRSGVIQSVHSFTQSPIGPALLWFLMFVIVGSLGLFAMRAHLVSSAPRLDSLVSREGMFLVNNLLLTVFAFIVVVGTLYPIVVEAITGDTVGVGRPFYDRMAVPIGFALVVAMALGPIVPYRSANLRVVWDRLRLPLQIGLAAGALAVVLGQRNGWILVSIVLGVSVAALAVYRLWEQARRAARKRETKVGSEMIRVLRGDAPYWGGQIGHVGVAVLVLGIALSSNLAAEGDFTLSPGQSAQFADHEITYVAPFSRDKPNRTELGAVVEIRRGGDLISTLEPRLNQYPTSTQSIASPAVDTGLRGDLYLSLASINESEVRLETYWFPFIWMVWAGGFLIALGAVFSSVVRKPVPVGREQAHV